MINLCHHFMTFETLINIKKTLTVMELRFQVLRNISCEAFIVGSRLGLGTYIEVKADATHETLKTILYLTSQVCFFKPNTRSQATAWSIHLLSLIPFFVWLSFAHHMWLNEYSSGVDRKSIPQNFAHRPSTWEYPEMRKQVFSMEN